MLGSDLLTFGGQVHTAYSLTDSAIAGQTLTPGGIITVDETPISLAPAATDAVVGPSTVRIGGLTLDGLNGSGGSSAGGNGIVARFFEERQEGRDLLMRAQVQFWSSFGLLLVMAPKKFISGVHNASG